MTEDQAKAILKSLAVIEGCLMYIAGSVVGAVISSVVDIFFS